jgi:hypothetical protein
LVDAGRAIEMGYGLHFGWAIEGAIGSSMKIDASYLSPHVNTAARLEVSAWRMLPSQSSLNLLGCFQAATKQFGVQILMSGDFVSRLCETNAKLCRRIDSVFLVGKAEHTALFTWDFWVGGDLSQNHALSPLSQLAKATGGDACTAFEYCAKVCAPLALSRTRHMRLRKLIVASTATTPWGLHSSRKRSTRTRRATGLAPPAGSSNASRS